MEGGGKGVQEGVDMCLQMLLYEKNSQYCNYLLIKNNFLKKSVK